jgi:hypothetical protein
MEMDTSLSPAVPLPGSLPSMFGDGGDAYSVNDTSPTSLQLYS